MVVTELNHQKVAVQCENNEFDDNDLMCQHLQWWSLRGITPRSPFFIFSQVNSVDSDSARYMFSCWPRSLRFPPKGSGYRRTAMTTWIMSAQRVKFTTMCGVEARLLERWEVWADLPDNLQLRNKKDAAELIINEYNVSTVYGQLVT